MVDVERIKELRQLTGAGVGDCRIALEKSDDNVQKAVRILREMGAVELGGVMDRKTSQGHVGSYIHDGGRVGVLVQVDCETDFAARNDALREFTHEVCLQVAAMRPVYVSRDDVPETLIQQETATLMTGVVGKPENIVKRIIEGQLGKWYSRVCLLEQPWVKDGERTIADMLAELSLSLGENVRVVRFSRFEGGIQ